MQRPVSVDEQVYQRSLDEETDLDPCLRWIGILSERQGSTVGNCGASQIDFINRSAGCGVLTAERDARGAELAPEAPRLILKCGFKEQGLHRLGLDVYSQTARAIRAREKAGFVRDGTLRESYYRSGVYLDTIVMSVLESEWRDT